MKKIEDILFSNIDPIKVQKINYQEALGIVYSKYKNQDEKIYLDSKDGELKSYHALTKCDRLKLSTFIKNQNDLLELYRQLVKDLGLVIEHDMTDTWGGLEYYEYLEINCDSIKALNTYKQIKELENE